jgi:hypothetical protein
MRSQASLCAGMRMCFFSTLCRVTWSIEGGDAFGYENVITIHFASAERRPRANNGTHRPAPPLMHSFRDQAIDSCRRGS